MAVWDASLTQLREIWSGLTAVQRLVLATAAVGLVVVFAGVLMWAGAPEYAVLYSRLAAEDAGEVVDRLKRDGVPYELRDGGRTVAVPSERVHELRLSMAGEGIPQGGVVGFEIFDKTGFGMTDFAQKVNYARALEGELTRTIRRIQGVDGARVHLVLPERRLFEEQAEPASASVVLQLRGGSRLGAKQIQGVVHLVASSVEGLGPDHVTVVDSGGNVLYQQSGDEGGMLASTQLDFKRGYEKDVEQRVRQMLERVLGEGSAVVQVAAVFDFDRVEETAETYDPQGVVVRSEERVTESSSGGGSGPSGAPGVTSNIGEGPQAAGPAGASTSSNRETETVNYEVSKRITRTEKGPGTLQRLSVAVAVDGTYREPNEAEGGKAKVFVPRTSEELGQIRALVEKAVGYDVARGDAVEVTSIPFRPAEVAEAEQAALSPELYLSLAKYGLAAVLGLLVIFFGVRPLVSWLTSMGHVTTVTEPVSVAEMERALAGAGSGPGGTPAAAAVVFDDTPSSDAVRRETLKKRLTEMVVEEPQIAAQLLRSWMTEE